MRNRMPEKRIAVIKAQDDRLAVTVSDGLAIEVQAEGTSYLWEVREFLASVDPDVILLDLCLPITLGANLLRILGETSSGKKVVLKPLDNVQLQGIV
jgi:DNA-binding response OmpR family regulator